MATEVELRELPAPDLMRTRCDGCGRAIVWAVTVAGPNGRGGKLMPLDPLEDLAGNVVATQPSARGRLLARVLCKDETIDRPGEYAGMPHFATCPAHAKPTLPEGVVDLTAERRKRRGRGRRR